MTKDILAELSKAPLVTKELIQYLAKQKIDANVFLVNASDINAYAELLMFFAEVYGLYISILPKAINITKENQLVIGLNIELPIRGMITMSIITAIRYANNPF